MKPIIIIILLIFISCNPESKERVCKLNNWTTTVEEDLQYTIVPPEFNVPFDTRDENKYSVYTTDQKRVGLSEPDANGIYFKYLVQFDNEKGQITKAWKLEKENFWSQGAHYSKENDRYYITDGYGKVHKFNQYTGKLTEIGDMKYRRTGYLFWANDTFFQETNIVCHTYLDENFPNATGSIWKFFDVNKEIQDKEEICLPEWSGIKYSDGEKLYFSSAERLYIYNSETDTYHFEKELQDQLKEKNAKVGRITDLSDKGKVYFSLNTRKKGELLRYPLYEYDLKTKKINSVINKNFSELHGDKNSVYWEPMDSIRVNDTIYMILSMRDIVFTYFLVKVNLKEDSCTVFYKNTAAGGLKYTGGNYIQINNHIKMNIHDNSIMRVSPTFGYPVTMERITE